VKGSIEERTFIESISDGRYSLQAVITVTMSGINIYLGGGERDHIGSIAVSIPRESLTGSGKISCTTSIFNLLSHKDGDIAIIASEEVCKRTNQVTVVCAGIHVDNATPDELRRLEKNARSLTNTIVTKYKKLENNNEK